jgi:hypothetical protein
MKRPGGRAGTQHMLLAALFSLAWLPCHASLGGAPSDFGNTSVRRAHTLAAATSAPAGFNINASTLPGGTSVREYVNDNGLVFAVSWSGPFLPDLRNLLGQHFQTFTSESARRPKAGHSRVVVKQQDVTIESTGHMRAYSGRAWVNSLLPPGFNTDDIE